MGVASTEVKDMTQKKLKIQRSALEHHKHVKKELVPPFVGMGPPTEQVFWARDLLPEFIWIEALVAGVWAITRQ